MRRDHYRREDGSLRSALIMARLFFSRPAARAAATASACGIDGDDPRRLPPSPAANQGPSYEG